jgi:hypothetical protein
VQVLLGSLVLLGVVALIAVLMIAAIAFMRRESSRHGSGSLGVAMQELESLFVESKRHVIHEVRAEKSEDGSPAGDPPVK